MSRDNMTCLVKNIARQALLTFRNPSPVSLDEANKAFVENRSKLKSLVTQCRAADLKLVPRSVESSGTVRNPPPPPHTPPVTYMHICETDAFSMGVFLLKSGASIPLHDHPGMHGILKVMYGKLRVTTFDRVDKTATTPITTSGNNPRFNPALQNGALRAVRKSVGEYTEESGACVLGPELDNLHRMDAVDGPTAFLDILAPPYDPDDGRDCHYYKVINPLVGDTGETVVQSETQEQKEVWLLEIAQPADFWCGGEPYPGPEVF